MGIASNKVTRRVALGSIAGGLAGTAAVLQVLKSKYRVPVADIDDSPYAKEWASCLKMTEVPIDRTSGPSSVTLHFKPPVDERLRVVNFNAHYDAGRSRAVYPQAPLHYFVATGEVTAIPSVIDNKPALLVVAEKKAIHSRRYEDKKPGGKCIFVPHNGDFDCFEAGVHPPKKLPLGKVNYTCVLLASSLMFDYPVGKPLAAGTKWTIPETAEFRFAMPCEIVGFAKVAGRQAIEISAERHLNNQEVRHYVIRSYEWNKKIEKERGSNFDVDAVLAREMKRVVESQQTQVHRLRYYVDVQTGIVLRSKWTMTLRSPKLTDPDETIIMLSQVIVS
ncbi:MAG: hypothetical protein LLF97_00935 [Planctomycetaceae bacterium]|nr:hypothetical protein [Planctomycetaceae bacterium]